MAIVFLIGGTGNQLFQYAASAPDDRMSTLFLKPAIRRILNWTQHEQVLRFPEPNVLSLVFALCVLAADLLIYRLFKRSCFTTFDTRGIKADPAIFELVRLGYFQKAPERRDVETLALVFRKMEQNNSVSMHIRGGDLLEIERKGQNTYGLLGEDYFGAALEIVFESSTRSTIKPTEICILTDDPDYASSFDFSMYDIAKPKIVNCPLKETFERAINSDWFISSNSTMSYWIVRLRGGRSSIDTVRILPKTVLTADICTRL